MNLSRCGRLGLLSQRGRGILGRQDRGHHRLSWYLSRIHGSLGGLIGGCRLGCSIGIHRKLFNLVDLNRSRLSVGRLGSGDSAGGTTLSLEYLLNLLVILDGRQLGKGSSAQLDLRQRAEVLVDEPK